MGAEVVVVSSDEVTMTITGWEEEEEEEEDGEDGDDDDEGSESDISR
jgi:hypothetical protein